MAEKVTYYAIVDGYTSKDEPAGVLRRFDEGDRRDESFGRTCSGSSHHCCTLPSAAILNTSSSRSARARPTGSWRGSRRRPDRRISSSAPGRPPKRRAPPVRGDEQTP